MLSAGGICGLGLMMVAAAVTAAVGLEFMVMVVPRARIFYLGR